jgi:adenine-specific DNA methylase
MADNKEIISENPCNQWTCNAENLFITGDNLEALKLLQESYLGKVDMIYIDPPYNTGKDFVYHDNFHKSAKFAAKEAGEIDDEGNRLVKNEKSNGNRRFMVDMGSDSSSLGAEFNTFGFANLEIKISESDLLKNLQTVQKSNGLLPSQKIERLNGRPVFTVENEE